VRTVFVDSVYWIAVVQKADQHREAALAAGDEIGRVRAVTTEEVLVEVFSSLCRAPQTIRRAAVELVRGLMKDPNVTVIPQSHQSFLAGLALYKKRLDQGYSLVDCISMASMRRARLRDVLTTDRHFAREGFRPLIRA